MQPAGSDRVSRAVEAVGDLTSVTIIIPVYNRLRFLKQAIESALGQTHPRVQVVVVDDGSPVDPAPALTEFGTRVELRRKPNGGLASARNCGIAHAAGDYLVFLDDDDFLEPTAVETLLAAIRAAGAVWGAGRFAYVDETGLRLPRQHPCRYQSGDVYERMIFNNLICATHTVMVRTDVMRSLGCFDERFLLCEDYDFWLTISRDYPICAVPDVVAYYRVHSTQISKRWAGMFESNLRLLRKHQERARPGYGAIFNQGLARIHTRYGDGLYVNGQHAEARLQWKRACCLNPRLARGSLLARVAKSYLPPALLATARRLAGAWRGSRLPWGPPRLPAAS
jgi:glycosyltransferase involved in cell wall biosynthesis